MEIRNLLVRIAASDGYRVADKDLRELEKKRLITMSYCRDDGGCICHLSNAGMQYLNEAERT